MGYWEDQQQGGWTVVRYGRGRQQSRQRNRNGGGGIYRGMDRAPPDPFRGRAQNPPPNRPVPPFGTYRHPGPQARSYASVVRGDYPGRVQRFQRSGLDQNRPQPSDPRFGRLVRKMHTVIKMVHHLQNVAQKEGKSEPRMISQMVEVLTSMIKPACPTAETVDLISGNAKNWGYNTLLILEEHYLAGLETKLGDLEKDLVPDWKPAFEVAKRWARRNLPRITQEVLDHAEALVTSRVRTEGDLDRPEPSMAPQAECTDNVLSAQTTRDTEPEKRTCTTRDTEQQTSTTRDIEQQTFTTRDTENQTSANQDVVDPQTRDLQRVSARHTVATMTEQAGQALKPVPQTRRKGLHTKGLLVREEIQVNTVGVQDNLDEGESSGEEGDSSGDEGDSLGDETNQDQQVRVQVHAEEGARGDSFFGDSQLGLTSTPRPQICRVTRHINTDRKMIDWDLIVRKKWLILGDSNLARIPGYDVPDLQIESYPGATFRHAQALMAKSSCHVLVEKLVLSFGLNCKAQKAKETAIRQLQGAVRAAKKKFPSAEIWIPLINFSIFLPQGEHATLHTLNAHIQRNMP